MPGILTVTVTVSLPIIQENLKEIQNDPNAITAAGIVRAPAPAIHAVMQPPTVSIEATPLPVSRAPSQGSRAAGSSSWRAWRAAAALPVQREFEPTLSVALDAAPTPVARQPSQGGRAAGSARLLQPQLSVAGLSVDLTADNGPSVRAPSQGSRAAGLWVANDQSDAPAASEPAAWESELSAKAHA